MNCKEAKQISIVGYLQGIGISPDNISNQKAWYKSPLRSEESPSFKVDMVKNLWYDHASGKGGNIIDLIEQLHRTSIVGALQILSGATIAPVSLSFPQQKDPSATFEVTKIQELQNRAIIAYLKSRGISFDTASIYLQEAYWKIVNSSTGEIKKYFGIAFQNDQGGLELNFGLAGKSIKMSSSPKWVTTIPGSTTNLNIFEGFFDFLSFLRFSKIRKSQDTNIILNSVSNLSKIIDDLSAYERISLYLDNDNAGEEATKRIMVKYPQAQNISSRLYPGFNDFNDFLTNHK
ncbi:MAG: toprim domain-containing protein [Bacteroidia bacterium]|nr:toprim domain-containing protein [Bacteroidia bacterium]